MTLIRFAKMRIFYAYLYAHFLPFRGTRNLREKLRNESLIFVDLATKISPCVEMTEWWQKTRDLKKPLIP